MKDAYYFPHDSNARHDLKIVAMKEKWKYGYQWYFMLLEILREQSEFKLDRSMIPAIAQQLQEPIEVIQEWLKDCLSDPINLFITDGKHLWSESLTKRMQHLENKREKMRENARKRWEKPTNTAVAVQPLSNCNASKVKESKVKESKVKESKVKKELYPATKVAEFESWWNLYNKKVGRKDKVMKKYFSLNDADRQQIAITLPSYLKATPDKTYRKHPMTYLNNRAWEDEIIIKNQNGTIRKNNLQSFD